MFLICLLARSQIRPPLAEETQPITVHVMPTAHPEHVTRLPAVIGRCQATCNQQKAR